MNNLLFNFVAKITNMLDGVETEREMVLRLAVGFAVFVLLFVFRNQISKYIAWLIGKFFSKKGSDAQNAIKSSIKKPLAIFVSALGFYGAGEIIAPAGEIRSLSIIVLKLGLILLVAMFAINLISSDYSFVLMGDDSKSKKTAISFLSNILKVVVGIVAILLVLEQFGISASRIFAALGIGGVAVAFACKDAVENMLSGFIIIFDKPFEVDDFIEINGETGTVEDIKIRTTRVRGVDGCERVYPNTTIASSPIINWSRMEKRLINENLWINYKHSDKQIEEYCNGIKDVILSFENVIKDDIRVNFLEYGTHALEINVFFYVNAVSGADYQKVKSDINVAIKEYADGCDMELAFTSQTLYFGDELKISQK